MLRICDLYLWSHFLFQWASSLKFSGNSIAPFKLSSTVTFVNFFKVLEISSHGSYFNSTNMILKQDATLLYMLIFMTLVWFLLLGMAKFYSEECRTCLYWTHQWRKVINFTIFIPLHIVFHWATDFSCHLVKKCVIKCFN